MPTRATTALLDVQFSLRHGPTRISKRGVCIAGNNNVQSQPQGPLDVVSDGIPFDVPYGPPISLERAQAAISAVVAEATKRDWKMNVAVVDSGGNLVAYQRMDGAMLASIEIAKHEARAAAIFRRETKFFEDAIQMNYFYLMTLNGMIASGGGIPLIAEGKLIGGIGCSGGTDSQDEIVCRAGVAVINNAG
jgi:glc operon protein GlcG